MYIYLNVMQIVNIYLLLSPNIPNNELLSSTVLIIMKMLYAVQNVNSINYSDFNELVI